MSEWIKVSDAKNLPNNSTILKVKRANGDEVKAYFHHDNLGRMALYHPPGKNLRWQDKKTLEFLQDVTHWMPLPKPPK